MRRCCLWLAGEVYVLRWQGNFRDSSSNDLRSLRSLDNALSKHSNHCSRGIRFCLCYQIYWQFLVSRFFLGSVIYGIYLPMFIMSGEFVGPRYRPLSQTILWFAFTAVLLVLALMAFFVRT